MKLKKKQEEKPKVSASVRGRRNRNKGADFERRVSKQLQEATGLEFVRTPQSGGFAKNKQTAEGFRGDIVPADSNADFVLHIECKNTQTIQIKKWWEQATSDCPKGKIPTIVYLMHIDGKQPKRMITLDMKDFLELAGDRLAK